MVTPCFVTSDNLRRKAVPPHDNFPDDSKTAPFEFGDQLVGNPLRTNFSKVEVLMHYGTSQITGKAELDIPFIALGFLEWVTNSGFNLKSPLALPPSKSVKRSFAALNPVVYVFLHWMGNLRFVILFQNRSVSSTLKTNSGG
ncbi:hypothetical protein TNCT_661421 [Trichonephila clavata]|uniref:Uncharacterized protein n=1 Tax=Trichonephila clavata TaxID=2740835 RepID=A0A8X6H4G8_TRICU|nr:hypothetical protein TNCT_661421 [Trichonephila clavata]